MKNRLSYTFILIMLLSYAQKTMNFTLKELEIKNKSELVELVFNLAKEKNPTFKINKADYKISAYKNSKEVIVKFERIVRFISSKKESAIFEITVNLVTKQSVSYVSSLLGQLYKPSVYDLKAIAFVKKHFGTFNPDFIHTITETENEYHIERTNAYSFGIYTLNKKTGEVISKLETSYLPTQKPCSDDENSVIEIF
ncbi:conserved hypothetical protein [Flavobacterium sp. 9AF]|uniref:hypothetical protein n=1 Tax=Flavobacterium sp. 9AF TaxID=2653142 RepID=UPI0012F39FFE|nr:hypothetical protein [Flavobacterium sp. 9AF]VXB20366.1 conserved hypothetical protein [Flavobacterium sp. 9AF]